MKSSSHSGISSLQLVVTSSLLREKTGCNGYSCEDDVEEELILELDDDQVLPEKRSSQSCRELSSHLLCEMTFDH